MSPVYDFSQPEDRLRYALSLLSRDARMRYARDVERRYGEAARQRLIEDLREYARCVEK